MKRRKCPMCNFEWDSNTVFGKDQTTPCPKCGEPVPGDSLAPKKAPEAEAKQEA